MEEPQGICELWCCRAHGAFYAVRLTRGRVWGARELFSAAALASRHELAEASYDPALGAHLSGRRQEFAVVERW
jgi:hypothetical protein